MFFRDQLKQSATLTEEDFVQLGRCRRPHNRLGFAYQVAFVRLFDRFPQQQPFELFEETGLLQRAPELRRRIQRGLLKVEQLHALARDVFYGRRGRINARELWEQMNTCSCLNLILACIVYWQAREISRVLSQCDPVANAVDTSLLEHVSPIEWG
jgi:Tn3 transposase DDE domain